MTRLIALDSNVFIAALTGNEANSLQAQRLLRDISSGRYKAVASSIAYGEVLGLSKGATSDLDVEGFFASIVHLSTIAADDEICLRAGELRKRYAGKLKLQDALHLATAIRSNADIFITDDVQLASAAQGLLQAKSLADWA